MLIVIPAYNPPQNLALYVKSLVDAGFNDILVVNDGSREEFDNIFGSLNNLQQCKIINHNVNLGKGKALKTAFDYFLSENKYDGIITVDCDGQHTVEDVVKVQNAMKIHNDKLILGCRDFNSDNVPNKSKYGNKITNFVFRLLYGRRFSDTQTGLRGFSKEQIAEFINISGDRFEYETNMLIYCCRNKIKIHEVFIKTVYYNDNSETHFRPVVDSLKIYFLIIKSFLKYSISSILSFLIDIGLFNLFLWVISNKFADYKILIATVLARVFSSAFNYIVNRKFVFKNKNSVIKSAVKYYLLCVLQMLSSAILVTDSFKIFDRNVTIIKIIIDTLLFIISYQIQQYWVFTQKKDKTKK